MKLFNHGLLKKPSKSHTDEAYFRMNKSTCTFNY